MAIALITGAGALACQLPSIVSQRPVRDSAPIDPDGEVVLEAIVERREDALENGKVTGDLWHAKVLRVLKGEPDLREVTQFIGNGSCWIWRPSIGGRGFMFGALISYEGRRYFQGNWFSPADAAAFSWVRFGAYRGPPPSVAPEPELQKPPAEPYTVPARPRPVNQGCGGNGLGGAC